MIDEIAEMEANAFARALLMPGKLIRREIAALAPDGQLTDRNVVELAKRFKVEQMWVVLRLQEMGFIGFPPREVKRRR